MEPTPLEMAVLRHCVAGTHPALVVLQDQLRQMTLAKREFTGAGFYADLAVPADVPRAATLRDEVQISDVVADVPTLSHSLGFVRYVRNGVMSLLECFTFGEEWPSTLEEFRVHYAFEARDLSAPA